MRKLLRKTNRVRLFKKYKTLADDKNQNIESFMKDKLLHYAVDKEHHEPKNTGMLFC